MMQFARQKFATVQTARSSMLGIILHHRKLGIYYRVNWTKVILYVAICKIAVDYRAICNVAVSYCAICEIGVSYCAICEIGTSYCATCNKMVCYRAI